MARPHAPRTRVSTYLSDWMFTGDATRQSVAGYVAGGQTPSYINRIDKFAFPNDTKSTLTATLTQNIAFSAGFADSGVAGYSAAGDDPSVDKISKISFPADTRTTLSATTSSIIYSATGFANSGVAGYISGGFDNAGGVAVARTDKITFPADTKTIISATLTTVVRQPAGFSDTGVAGYIAGGSETVTLFSRIDKITFPADTKSTLSATLTTAADFICGFSNYGVAGYTAGGEDSGGFVSRLDKIAFPSDTKTTLSATLTSVVGKSPAGFSDTGVAGYVAGGVTTGPTKLDRVDKIAFPADTKSTLSAVLTVATQNINCGFADCGVL